MSEPGSTEAADRCGDFAQERVTRAVKIANGIAMKTQIPLSSLLPTATQEVQRAAAKFEACQGFDVEVVCQGDKRPTTCTIDVRQYPKGRTKIAER